LVVVGVVIAVIIIIKKRARRPVTPTQNLIERPSSGSSIVHSRKELKRSASSSPNIAHTAHENVPLEIVHTKPTFGPKPVLPSKFHSNTPAVNHSEQNGKAPLLGPVVGLRPVLNSKPTVNSNLNSAPSVHHNENGKAPLLDSIVTRPNTSLLPPVTAPAKKNLPPITHTIGVPQTILSTPVKQPPSLKEATTPSPPKVSAMPTVTYVEGEIPFKTLKEYNDWRQGKIHLVRANSQATSPNQKYSVLHESSGFTEVMERQLRIQAARTIQNQWRARQTKITKIGWKSVLGKKPSFVNKNAFEQ
jgi:hypothetical protein